MSFTLPKPSMPSAPLRIILPVLLTVALFVATLFLIFLPRLESRLMDRKRETIRELTETAWRTLDFYAEAAETGDLALDRAKSLATAHLRHLRYGHEGKDYFWINDMHPNLIMHPYRPDLEGTDISGFADPTGKHLFVEIVKTVRAEGAGYVDYQWQWKDDPDRIVPKISYVKGFAPWGWVVGTGIYVEDVRAEIAAVTRRLTVVSIGILAVVSLLMAYVIRQGGRAEGERRRAEDALRTSEARYRLLAETATEIILTVDLEGRVTYVNQAGQRLLGYSMEGIRKLEAVALFPTSRQEAFRDRMDRCRAGTLRDPLYETVFFTRRGETVPVEATLAMVRDGETPVGFLLTARDISARKRAEQQAREQREQLLQTARMASVGGLVAGMAGEIERPVGVIEDGAAEIGAAWAAVRPVLDARIDGDAETGELHWATLRERVPERVREITEGAGRVMELVQDLRDYARPDPPVLSDMLDVNRVVEKAAGLLASRIAEATDRFSVHPAADLPTFQGNFRKMEQVVIQLLTNACNALTDRTRSIRVETGHDAHAGCVYIEVRDGGVGIRPDALPHLTEPFYTAHPDGGTGLGLAIADRIIRDHGGTLTFSSDVDLGTTVRVCLPVGAGGR